MKQFDPMMFVSVFQEMLGWLFWPLVAFVVLGALALLIVLVRDRGVNSRRLVLSEIIGFFGGFLAVAFMLWVTSSSLDDLLGGPIDWLLTIGIWVAGAVGGTIAAYVVMGFATRRAPGSSAHG